MRTKKQVLVEFQAMQSRFCEKNHDMLVNVQVYNTEHGFWTVKLGVYEYSGNIISLQDSVEWTRYLVHGVEDEIENERRLAEFRKKYNL